MPKVTEKDYRRARNLLLFDTLNEVGKRTGMKRGPYLLSGLEYLASPLTIYCIHQTDSFGLPFTYTNLGRYRFTFFFLNAFFIQNPIPNYQQKSNYRNSKTENSCEGQNRTTVLFVCATLFDFRKNARNVNKVT